MPSEVTQARARGVVAVPATVTITVSKVPGELWRWARIAALDHDTSAAVIVIEALELYRAVVEGVAEGAGEKDLREGSGPASRGPMKCVPARNAVARIRR